MPFHLLTCLAIPDSCLRATVPLLRPAHPEDEGCCWLLFVPDASWDIPRPVPGQGWNGKALAPSLLSWLVPETRTETGPRDTRGRHLCAPGLETKQTHSHLHMALPQHTAVTDDSCHEPWKSSIGQSPFYRVFRQSQSPPSPLCNFGGWQRPHCEGHSRSSCCICPIINRSLPANRQAGHRWEEAHTRSPKCGLDQRTGQRNLTQSRTSTIKR